MGSSQSAIEQKARGKPDPPVKDWELHLNTWPRKAVAIALILASAGFLVYRTWWLFLAAWITREGSADPAVYERAIRYDPQNADYHFVLAQLYNYATVNLNIERAGEEYEAAVRLNPNRAVHWLELSKYYEQEGNIERSRYAMQMAIERDPNYAQTHWSAANLFIRLEDYDAANLELRRAADLDGRFLTQVLDLVWRLNEDPGQILASNVPNTKQANLAALNYFISKNSVEGTELAWNRLKSFETTPRERFDYIRYLIGIGQPHMAWRVFALNVTPEDTLFYNGSFDTEPLDGGFDWRYSSTDDAESGRDMAIVKDGLASFLVSFSGETNLNYSDLTHLLAVDTGRQYVLKFWMKTDGITSNEGPFVEVDGQASAPQLGTTYWQEFSIPFTASADLVTVRLLRQASKKFDNLIKGKVWVDGFSLIAIR